MPDEILDKPEYYIDDKNCIDCVFFDYSDSHGLYCFMFPHLSINSMVECDVVCNLYSSVQELVEK